MKTVPVAPVVTSESKTSSSADLPGAKKTESKGCFLTDQHNIQFEVLAGDGWVSDRVTSKI